jgi:hypothetical protein
MKLGIGADRYGFESDREASDILDHSGVGSVFSLPEMLL